MKISILWGSLTNPISRGGGEGRHENYIGRGLPEKGGGWLDSFQI